MPPVETSLLFLLNADRVVTPKRITGGLRQSLPSKVLGPTVVAVPCRDAVVPTKKIAPVLVAAAIWRLREDGAIALYRAGDTRVEDSIDGTTAGDDRSPTNWLTGTLIGQGLRKAWLTLLPGGVTVRRAEPVKRGPGLEAGLEKLIPAKRGIELGELANKLSLKHINYDMIGIGGPGMPGPAAAVSAGVKGLVRHRVLKRVKGDGDGGIEMAGRRVEPNCAAIAALEPEFESHLAQWQAFRKSEAKLSSDLVSIVRRAWTPGSKDHLHTPTAD